MTSKILAASAALALALSGATLAYAAKKPAHKAEHHHHHHHFAKGKACKGEFMYMKAGKCKDARKA